MLPKLRRMRGFKGRIRRGGKLPLRLMRMETADDDFEGSDFWESQRTKNRQSWAEEERRRTACGRKGSNERTFRRVFLAFLLAILGERKPEMRLLKARSGRALNLSYKKRGGGMGGREGGG